MFCGSIRLQFCTRAVSLILEQPNSRFRGQRVNKLSFDLLCVIIPSAWLFSSDDTNPPKLWMISSVSRRKVKITAKEERKKQAEQACVYNPRNQILSESLPVFTQVGLQQACIILPDLPSGLFLTLGTMSLLWAAWRLGCQTDIHNVQQTLSSFSQWT